MHILGEHGESQFVAWSSAAIGSIPLASFPLPSGMSLAQIQADCETATRRRGADIHTRKGYTSYGIGTEVALGLPCTIGRKGVARRLLLQLDAEEHGRLEKSAMVLAMSYRSLS